MIPVLSRQTVIDIAHRFSVLNPYNREFVDEILKVEKVNFDEKGNPRDLFGFSISAKRYVLYERTGRRGRIVEPKAHGLGYLYPPTRDEETSRRWTRMRGSGCSRMNWGFPQRLSTWLQLPAMMRVVLSTPIVLDRLNRGTRPYNFLFCPLIDATVGYPQGLDPADCTVIAPFTKNRRTWLGLPCINVRDGRQLHTLARTGRAAEQDHSADLRLHPALLPVSQGIEIAWTGRLALRGPHAGTIAAAFDRGGTTTFCRQGNRPPLGVRRGLERRAFQGDGVSACGRHGRSRSRAASSSRIVRITRAHAPNGA